METIIRILIIACLILNAKAQTPFDSFAPDVSRPMLQLEPETLKDTVSGKTISNLQKEQIKDDIRKWLSVDPLADKYPNISPYAYCGWNPINAIDPAGKEWKDIDGNIIKDHSNIKAYIFYNKNDFNSQSIQMYADLESQYGKGSVALSDVLTTREFRQDWQNMESKNIREVDINHHGNNQTIILDNNKKNPQYITSTGNGMSNRSCTPAINVGALGKPRGNICEARLNLNTCHSQSKNHLSWISERVFGPTLKGTKQTLMEGFVYNYNFNSVRGTSAGVSYNRTSLQPEPQFFFQSWVYFLR